MTRVIFGCGYLPDPIQACFGERALGLALEYVVEPRPMGTAGGIRHAARGRVSETFLALNGDVLADAPLADLVALHRERGGHGDDRAAAGGRSRAATASCAPTADGRVLGFLEKPQPEEIDTDLINAGAYVLEPAVLDLIDDGRAVSIERETFPSLVGAGLFALAPERLLVRRRHAGELHRGPSRPARRAHPLAAARPRGRMRAGSTTSATVSPDAVLEAPCQVAARSGRRLRARASAPAAPWPPDAQIEARAQLRGAVVQERANVGEGAIVDGRRRSARAHRSARAPTSRRARSSGPASSIPPGASVAAGERVFPEGARVGVEGGPMSRYEEMFALVGQLGAQLREGYAAGQAALGRARAPSAPASGDDQRAGRLGHRRQPRGGALARLRARADLREPRGHAARLGRAGRSGAAGVLQRRDRRDARGRALGARARRRRDRRDRRRAARAASSATAADRSCASPAACRRARRSARSSGPWRQRSSTRAPSRRPPSDIRAAAHACDAVAGDRGGSLASALGEALATTTTWVYGYGPLAAVARRFKSQLNENAKSTAAFGELPEADHNEIVGWAGTTPHGRPPRGDPPGRPGRPADDPRQHRHDAAPDRRRRHAAPRAHGRGPDAHGARLLAALAARPRVASTRRRQQASIRSRSTASPSSSRRSPQRRRLAGGTSTGRSRGCRERRLSTPWTASPPSRSGSCSAPTGAARATWHERADADRWLDCIGATETRGFPDDIRELRCPRHQVARSGRRGPSQDRVGRSADAGAGRNSRALRAGAAAGGPADRVVPARHDRDGEPDAHAQGGRGRRRAVRVESALDAGRGRGGDGRALRHRRVRHPRRRRRRLLPATSTPRSTPSRTSASTTAPT